MLESTLLNTMMVRRFFALAADERRLVIDALVLQGAIAVGLRAMRFGQLRRLLERIGRPGIAARTPEAATVERVAWAVRVTSRYLGAASTCLTQSLAAAALLGRRGHPSDVAIGVHPPDGNRLRAHAWVESRGSIVFGTQDRFATLARLTAPVVTGVELAS